MKRQLLFLIAFVGLITAAMAADGLFMQFGEYHKVTFSITDAGDTARVIKVNQFAAVNGQDYIDTFHSTAWVSGDFDSVVTWTAPGSGTDLAMVIDSMVAYINSDDSISKYVIAANSGDTVYTITARKKGVDFTVVPGDTSQDTSTTVANATSASELRDSFAIGDARGWQSADMNAILQPALSAHAGLGESDSAGIWFCTIRHGVWVEIDSAKQKGLPDTLTLRVPQATGDTLLGDAVGFKLWIWDSCSDTNLNVTYPLKYEVTLE